MTAFVDLIGLTQSEDPAVYADRLGLEGGRIATEQQRYELLSRLRQGAGVKVVTGPLGAPFWALVSPEVTVRIEPDGEDYDERVLDLEEWGLSSQGISKTDRGKLLQRLTPVPGGHDSFGLVERSATRIRSLLEVKSLDPIVESDLDVRIITDATEQEAFLHKCEALLSFDWEWDEKTFLPIGLAVSDSTRNWYLPVEKHANFRKWVGEVHDNGDVRVIYHNAKGDLQSQYPGDLLSLVGKPIEDTIVLAYLAGEPVLDLKTLTKKLLNRDAMGYPGSGLKDLPVELQARYACSDTRNTYDLYQHFTSTLDASTLSAYETIERPLIPVIASMEKAGSPLSREALSGLLDTYRWAEEGLRSFCWQRWRKDVSKDKETRELLTELLGYDPGTLDQRTLSRIQEEWIDVIIGYRKIRTLRRNYLRKLEARAVQWTGPTTPRIYPRFNQAGGSDTLSGRSFKSAPRTGRLSSADPNVQQISADLRSIFIPPEGCLYWYFDYSQLELRVAADLSQDPVMLGELSRDGGDLHSLMQQRINKELDVDVSRYTAKRSNFLLRYGGGADMLVTVLALERIFLPMDLAEEIVRIDHETFTGYWSWFQGVVDGAKQKGYGSTLAGRHVSYPDLRSVDSYLRSHAERAVGNLAVQGSASDIVKRAMVESAPLLRHYGATLSIQVHDSLSGWVPNGNAAKFWLGMKTVMESQKLPGGLPLLVEGGLGINWEEASR